MARCAGVAFGQVLVDLRPYSVVRFATTNKEEAEDVLKAIRPFDGPFLWPEYERVEPRRILPPRQSEATDTFTPALPYCYEFAVAHDTQTSDPSLKALLQKILPEHLTLSFLPPELNETAEEGEPSCP